MYWLCVEVEWSKPPWRGSDFHAGSASPAPSNVLRSGRRRRGQAAITDPASAAAAALCLELGGQRHFPVFHSECCPQERFWWELVGVVETQWKAEGVEQCGDITRRGASRDSFSSGNQAQRNYSLTCLSPPSTSVVHSKKRFATSWWKGLLLDLTFGSFMSFLVVPSPFALILAIMQMMLCDMRPAFGLWWMQQIHSSSGVIIRGTAFKSRFPVQYNYSYLNKGLRQCYSAAPLYTKWGLFPLDTAFLLLFSENDFVRIKL